MSGTPLGLRFVTSAPDVAHLPRTDAEVALAGRSNVGKSSLLNALAGRRKLAKVSQTPGRTRLLNCFTLEEDGPGDGAGDAHLARTLVDLPGYGYATASATDRRAWQQRMEHYLLQRDGLLLTLLLVDGEIGPTRLDVDMLAWLRAGEVPFRVVATKHDKVKSSKRERRRRDLAAGCGLPADEVVWASADRGVGIDRTRALVRAALAGDPATTS